MALDTDQVAKWIALIAGAVGVSKYFYATKIPRIIQRELDIQEARIKRNEQDIQKLFEDSQKYKLYIAAEQAKDGKTIAS